MKKFLFITFVMVIVIGLIITGCGSGSTPATTGPATTAAAAPKNVAPAATNPAPAVSVTPKASPAAAAPGKVYELDFIRFFGASDLTYKAWKPLFIDKINERAKGELVIKDRGGTEVIGQFDQAMAVKNGVMKVALTSTGFSTSVVPGMDTLRLSRLSPQEERAKVIPYVQEQFNKAGLYFVGRGQPITNGYMYWIVLRKSVATQADFTTLRLGSSPSFHATFRGWGSTPLNLAIQEYYSAVERGVADGNATGLNSYVAIAEYEVAPYVIDQAFYNTTTYVTFNLATWNSLPAYLQKIVMDTQLELEQQWDKIHNDNDASLRQAAMAKGAKFIKLAPDVNTWFFDTAYKVGWEDDVTKYPADVVNKMKELLAK